MNENEKTWRYIQVPHEFSSVKVPIAHSSWNPWDHPYSIEIELHSMPGGIKIGMNEEHKIIAYSVQEKSQ